MVMIGVPIGIGLLLFNSMRVLQTDVTGDSLIVIFITVYAIEMLAGVVRTCSSDDHRQRPVPRSPGFDSR